MPRPKYKIQFYKGNGKHKFRWRIIASNGRIVCSGSEGYLHKHGPVKTVNRLLEGLRNYDFVVIDDT